MHSASAVRVQIEAALARKIPSALSPAVKAIRAVTPSGIDPLDALLQGGLPIGAVTELIGPECSGRTSVALSSLARITRSEKVCAWIDTGDAFDPLSAAASGVDLDRLLWIRCGAVATSAPYLGSPFTVSSQYLTPPAAKKGVHGGGFGPHPRTEASGLSSAIEGLFDSDTRDSSGAKPRAAETQLPTHSQQHAVPFPAPASTLSSADRRSGRPWSRIEQALRAADLLLHGGGFSAIVLDMGSIAPEFVSRIPLATWYRYRAAAERTQSSILLVTQYACAKSSAQVVLEFQSARPICEEKTVFSGITPHVQIARQRFASTAATLGPLRKLPQSVRAAQWASRTASAGPR